MQHAHSGFSWHSHRNLRHLVAAIALVVCQSVAMAAQPAQLVRPAADSGTPGGTWLGAVRQQVVETDTAVLAAASQRDRLAMTLFDGQQAEIIIDRAWDSGIQTKNWQGRVEGIPHSVAIFVLHQGVVVGAIQGPGLGAFRLRHIDRNRQMLEQIDDSAFPPCGNTDAHVVRAEPGHDNGEGGIAGASCGLLVDVMVVYTEEARIQMAGSDPNDHAPIQALAIMALNYTNYTYSQSAINTRVRLVYVGEVVYTETNSFFTELDNLTTNGDGFMDEVHALRDQYGADIVSMLISHTQNGTICGIGWLMGSPPSQSFENFGFNVNNTMCSMPPAVTVAHEIGHNMGCHHDHDNAGGTPAFDYSYGHRFDGGDGVEYRTVMAYAPGQRIPHFSNPNILYQGTPTGIPGSTDGSPSPPDAADNARSINETGPIVATFRNTVIPQPAGWSTDGPIIAEDTITGDHFGNVVAIDGNVAIVGAFTDDDDDNPNLTDTGSAYILRFNAKIGVWEEEAKLTASDAVLGDRFGASVDILSHDGEEVAVVGAPFFDGNGRNSGAAYFFRRSGSQWIQEDKVTAADHFLGDQFGWSVSIARLGSTEYALISGHFNDDLGTNCGSAYVFHKSGTEWVQDIKLTPATLQAQDEFGYSVALASSPTGDELFAVIGAPRDDEDSQDSGAVYFYSFGESETWQFVAKHVDPLSQKTPRHYGHAVALTYGSVPVALIGAPFEDGLEQDAGAAYVVEVAQGVAGAGTQLLPPEPRVSGRFGNAVGISGTRGVIGSSLLNANAVLDSGAAYVIADSGAFWDFEDTLTAPDAQENDQFGHSVAMSGEHVAVGTWSDNHPVDNGENAGSVYFFAPSFVDCNNNGVDDFCDIGSGTSLDENANNIPDECEVVGACCLPDETCVPNVTIFGCEGSGGTYQGDETQCVNVDCTGQTCEGDVNGDGSVNVDDLLEIINNWGACSGCPADLDNDGQVNVDDLLNVINHWGACP